MQRQYQFYSVAHTSQTPPVYLLVWFCLGTTSGCAQTLLLIQYSGITPGRVQELYECWQWLCTIKYLIHYISLAQFIYYLLLFRINGVHTSGTTPGSLLRKSDDAGDQTRLNIKLGKLLEPCIISPFLHEILLCREHTGSILCSA